MFSSGQSCWSCGLRNRPTWYCRDCVEQKGAVARDMLNALQLVAAHYPHWASHFTEQQIDRDTIGLVRAAIAKAEAA